jgi:hypothetical protein
MLLLGAKMTTPDSTSEQELTNKTSTITKNWTCDSVNKQVESVSSTQEQTGALATKELVATQTKVGSPVLIDLTEDDEPIFIGQHSIQKSNNTAICKTVIEKENSAPVALEDLQILFVKQKSTASPTISPQRDSEIKIGDAWSTLDIDCPIPPSTIAVFSHEIESTELDVPEQILRSVQEEILEARTKYQIGNSGTFDVINRYSEELRVTGECTIYGKELVSKTVAARESDVNLEPVTIFVSQSELMYLQTSGVEFKVVRHVSSVYSSINQNGGKKIKSSCDLTTYKSTAVGGKIRQNLRKSRSTVSQNNKLESESSTSSVIPLPKQSPNADASVSQLPKNKRKSAKSAPNASGEVNQGPKKKRKSAPNASGELSQGPKNKEEPSEGDRAATSHLSESSSTPQPKKRELRSTRTGERVSHL